MLWKHHSKSEIESKNNTRCNVLGCALMSGRCSVSSAWAKENVCRFQWQTGLRKLWNPAITDGITWRQSREHGEHGKVAVTETSNFRQFQLLHKQNQQDLKCNILFSPSGHIQLTKASSNSFIKSLMFPNSFYYPTLPKYGIPFNLTRRPSLKYKCNCLAS